MKCPECGMTELFDEYDSKGLLIRQYCYDCGYEEETIWIMDKHPEKYLSRKARKQLRLSGRRISFMRIKIVPDPDKEKVG